MGKKGVLGIDESNFDSAMKNWKLSDPLIKNSIKSKCYFETILLIHQQIEMDLRIMFTSKTVFQNMILDPTIIKARRPKLAKLRNEIFSEIQYNYSLFNQLNFLCGAYDEGLYEQFSEFNKFRNNMVHGFLRGKINKENLNEKVEEGLRLREIVNKVLEASISKDNAIFSKCNSADRRLVKHLIGKPK